MSTSRPLRVLLLIKGLGLGGAERMLERSVPHLNREQFDYRVAYLLPWKNALAGAIEAAGIPVHCLNVRYSLDPGALGRLTALLVRERIDLVHAHLPITGVLARLAKRRGGVRALVYTEHGVPSRSRVLTRLLNATTYRLNDAVIAVSEEVARQIRPYLRGGHPRLLTIPNAIDASMFEGQTISRESVCREFGFPPDAHLIVNVGNLRSVKGHRYLLAAARRVIDHEPRARFLLVGIGPLAGRLANNARELGLNGQVVFTGFRPDAAALIGAADLFVLPSVYEGLPVALLEAMALGRPAVATRVGGISEIVTPGETGVLVAPRDPDSLAKEILSLLSDPPRRLRMGEAARRHVQQRHSMAQMVAAVEEVYRQVAAQ